MARQRLGQHFLASEAWRARIRAALDAPVGGTWIEIGAGHGEMTQRLAGAGRRVIAIEADPRLAEDLHVRAREWPGVEVVTGDVLSLDLGQLGGPRFQVYGNLPYYITSPILHHLFRFADQIAGIHVVVQLEVAARIVAPPGTRAFGYLSALCQFYAHPEMTLRIPPGAFRPPPKVSSALVQMKLPGERAALSIQDEPGFLKFVQVCFSQKRKRLRNNLRAVVSVERAEAALAVCGVGLNARAEELMLRQFADLFMQIRRP